MNRREFFKVSGALTAAVAIPLPKTATALAVAEAYVPQAATAFLRGFPAMEFMVASGAMPESFLPKPKELRRGRPISSI